MRVLEIIHGLMPGGAESALVRRLRHQPEDVRSTVLSTTLVAESISGQLAELGVRVLEHSLSRRDARWLREFTADEAPDVIVSHSPRETIQLLRWNRPPRTPLVAVAHAALVSDDPRNRLVKELAFRVLNHRADLHIAVSTPAAQGAQCAGARRVEVHLLGSELDPPSTTPSIWPADAGIRLMTLSRLVWFKNITALVEAVARESTAMRATRAHLVIVGSGPMRDEIAERIDRVGVGDLVSMHGRVANPADLLMRTDVLVSCATSEGGPLTVFEASLAGARVLSTPTGVAPEVLATDPGSVLTAGSTPSDLAAGLVRVLAMGSVDASERARRAAGAGQWRSSVRAAGFYDLVRSALP